MNNDGAPAALPTRNPFSPKTVDVEGPSGRKYTLRELNGFEQLQADGASASPAEALYYRTGLAIDSIDGEKILPRSKKSSVDALLRLISGPDTEALVLAYTKAFSPQLQGDDVKNSEAPSDS